LSTIIHSALLGQGLNAVPGRSGKDRASAATILLQDLLATSDSLIYTSVDILANLRKLLWEGHSSCIPTAVAATDTLGTPYSQTDEDYWTSNEGLTSERQFQTKLMYLVNVIQYAYEHNDLDGICDAVRRILWVRDQIEVEPLLSVYVTGLVLSLLVVGHTCADSYQIEDGYRISNQCAILLTAKRMYRAASALPVRPDSECYYRLYELVAELKWKGGEEWLEAFTTPEQLIDEYSGVEQRCLDYLRQTPSNDPTRNLRVKEALGWCRLQIIKVALRWCPGLADELIQGFNKLHGTKFTSEPGAFLDGRCVDAKNPWFWDLELFKWCVRGQATPEEAFLCHQWRLDAMRSKRPDRKGLEAYELATIRELQSLLHLYTDKEGVDAA
jgi:hypothetical protein